MSTLLHVVGTCIDDDGVKSVQVKLDDRDPAAADGGEFWAWEMSAEGLTEGVHTLTVHGVDVNGLEGPAQTIRFNVDKKPPTTRIVSHPNGAIVIGHGHRSRARSRTPTAWHPSRRASTGARCYEPLKLDLDKPGQKGTLPLRPRHPGPWTTARWSSRSRPSTARARRGRTAFLAVREQPGAPRSRCSRPRPTATVNGKVIVIGPGRSTASA